jgi:Holliday junction resolvase RusA-like endonuclease
MTKVDAKPITEDSVDSVERVVFTVPGKPRGKGRPRFTKAGGFVRTYTDRATASYENLVALEYERAGGKLTDKPICMTVTAVYPIPKGVSKKMREAMLAYEVLPRIKPDIDNVLKAILDGLDGVAYHDDTQVQHLTAARVYGAEPRVQVILREMTGARFK